MKKNILKSTLVVAAIAGCVCLSQRTHEFHGSSPVSELLYSNIEALSKSTDATDYKWFTIHTHETDNSGHYTGRCLATSYPGHEGSIGPYDTPHSHPLKACCSR